MAAGKATPKETQTEKQSARHTQEHKQRGNNTKVERRLQTDAVFLNVFQLEILLYGGLSHCLLQPV